MLKNIVLNVSYQNKGNRFQLKNKKKNHSILDDSSIMDSIVNGSNALMTSDCKPHHSNISATLSQYDNQHVKFIKYVNKSRLGGNSFVSNNTSGLNASRIKKPNRVLNQSSVMDGDDS